jgi:hypothetical protein
MDEKLAILVEEIRRLQDDGHLPTRPDHAQIVDWVYGNTVIENDDITRDMVERAASRER